MKLGNLYGHTGGSYAGNVYSISDIAPTIRTRDDRIMVVEAYPRTMCGRSPSDPGDCTHDGQSCWIRKLTPRECGRLMDVSDEDISKMQEVNSDFQLYKQFGNSIVVSVMCAMFEQLGLDKIEEPRAYVVLYEEIEHGTAINQCTDQSGAQDV